MVSECIKNIVRHVLYCKHVWVYLYLEKETSPTKEANNFLCWHLPTPLQLGCKLYQSDALMIHEIGSQTQKTQGQWGLISGIREDCYDVQWDPVGVNDHSDFYWWSQ